MRYFAGLLASALLAACRAPAVPEPTHVQATLAPDYSLAAFGGRLLGTDRGEWIGRLLFQDAEGHLHVLLKQNVHGLIANPQGVFAFTGLAHMGTNEGYLYQLLPGPTDFPQPVMVGRLPGSPSQVQAVSPGVTSFLVFTGRPKRRTD